MPLLSLRAQFFETLDVNIYMSGPQHPNLRKRKHTKLSLPPLNEISHQQSKRQRRTYHGSQPLGEYWDNLSRVWLTKRALRELNRRNAQHTYPSSCSPYRAGRPLTRSFRTELERSRQSTRSAHEFIANCVAKTVKNIKLFARHGGPDLSDLRGVRIFPLPYAKTNSIQ